jgi:putative Mg2+ transporter-C (MgtC) family protein
MTFAISLDVLMRLLLGTSCGMLIGWQRARSHKAVGMRTLGLIALGAALATSFTLAPGQTLADANNAGRVVQGLLGGIGFIGAGVILHGRGAHRIHGLTTAAAIWFTALVGAMAGLGLAFPAIIATILGVGLLMIDEEVEK